LSCASLLGMGNNLLYTDARRGQQNRFAQRPHVSHLRRMLSPPRPLTHSNAPAFPRPATISAGALRSIWQQNGALPVFGYPLTDEPTEQGRTVQYFERQRFELHSENAAPYDVLQDLAEEVLQQQGIDWHTQPLSPEPVAN
jgi:hypothetical protein